MILINRSQLETVKAVADFRILQNADWIVKCKALHPGGHRHVQSALTILLNFRWIIQWTFDVRTFNWNIATDIHLHQVLRRRRSIFFLLFKVKFLLCPLNKNLISMNELFDFSMLSNQATVSNQTTYFQWDYFDHNETPALQTLNSNSFFPPKTLNNFRGNYESDFFLWWIHTKWSWINQAITIWERKNEKLQMG